MKDFEQKEYKIFELFRNQWALAAAGTLEKHNACTVAWGSLGTLWTRPSSTGSIVTIYLHPSRYTCDYFRECDMFTVGFFPMEYRKALAHMGACSGRDRNKEIEAGLNAVAFGNSIAYQEASMTLLCKKIYGYPFAKAGLSQEVKDYYVSRPGAFPLDENGDWNPHWMFVGDIVDIKENEE